MKQKIKEALQQGHKNLGLSEEVFERVAASVETFISDEAMIEAYVNSDNTKALLKSYQSIADKARAEAKKKQEPKNEPKQEPEQLDTEPKQESKQEPNIADIVAQAVAAAITPLQDKLTAFETAQVQKGAVTALDELKATWDYAKGYPSESADAYEQTMELYEATGKKWSADELKAKFTEKFNKAVSKKGVDTSKPYKSDGSGAVKTDFSDHVAMLRAQGVDVPTANNK